MVGRRRVTNYGRNGEVLWLIVWGKNWRIKPFTIATNLLKIDIRKFIKEKDYKRRNEKNKDSFQWLYFRLMDVWQAVLNYKLDISWNIKLWIHESKIVTRIIKIRAENIDDIKKIYGHKRLF